MLSTNSPVKSNIRRPGVWIGVKDMCRFYWAVVCTAFRHSWKVTGGTATALGIIWGILAYFFPAWRITKMTGLLWQIPIGLCVFLLVARLVLAPYWLYKDKEFEAQAHAVDLESKNREISD